MSNESGVLYIVATPIGNLEDLSPRAARVLSTVDVIAAEDTRHSVRLLRHIGVSKPMIAFHEHNERSMTERLCDRVAGGEAIALISDAGTPLMSDPGYQLVRRARERGLKVVPIPGPSALLCAVSAAGLPTDRFVFEGFLPAKRGARRRQLEALAHEPRTLVFFEAPHRVLETLTDMAEVFGAERRGVVARELTKLYETFRADTLGGLRNWLAAEDEQRQGEFVVMLEGCSTDLSDQADQDADRVLTLLLGELPVKRAAALSAAITGQAKNRLYQRALELVRDADEKA